MFQFVPFSSAVSTDRMPQPIGNFISKRVYNGRLKTAHNIESKRSCRLVDVHHGSEVFEGNSWVVLHTHSPTYSRL